MNMNYVIYFVILFFFEEEIGLVGIIISGINVNICGKINEVVI